MSRIVFSDRQNHDPDTHPLLISYKIFHSESNLMNDYRLCNRKYVLGTYGCPEQLGNRMHEFINAFIGAVITNRTLLWSFCHRSYCQSMSEEKCSLYMSRQSWLPSAESVFRRLDRLGCPISGSEMKMNLIVPKSHHVQEAGNILACCKIDRLSERIIDFGVLERHEMMSLSFEGSLISDKLTKNRLNLLFKSGEYALYGNAFRSLFSFTPAVHEWNYDVVAGIGASHAGIEEVLLVINIFISYLIS